ncbi:MAG: RNA polymerase sigma-I factor [Alkaliphilus sp.]|nr:RNA polymerase sigma-I factor [Alkaliphilus sp.]
MRLLEIFRSDSIVSRLDKAKAGDSLEREKLIQEYIPFIIKTVSNKINRYIESENSEEYSIGLMAFNEAIEKYEKTKGSFIAFAELVIKSRITDFLRKSIKYNETFLLNNFEEREVDSEIVHNPSNDFSEAIDLKDEIKELEKTLRIFDITFSDLVKEAPKHADTREKSLMIAKYIASNPELKEELLRKKNLPSSQLVKALDITPKILKRSRKFIIATVLIIDSDLDIIRDYISKVGGGVVNDIQGKSIRS